MDNLKTTIKHSFFNHPKAKAIISIIGAAAVIAGAVTIAELRKTVTISVDNVETTYITYKGNVNDVLSENGIEVCEKDKVEPALDSRIRENETIKLKRAVPVVIEANGVELVLDSAEDTVENMLDVESDYLKDNGIEFDKGIDEISCNLDDNIKNGLNIQITKVDVKDVIEKQDIAFDTIVENDDNLDTSVKQVKQEGINGQKEITYKVVYKDGVETKREIKSTKTLSQPTNEVIVQGTAHFFASRGANGKVENIKGKKQILCTATAYTGGALTCSGTQPCRNPNGMSTIAVDPTVIPMGTKVFVDGYGYAVASDTGGAIKGQKIDVYLNSEKDASAWGVKNVNVTIIAYPGEW